jgi:predicted Zn-ribbon and HTH transcriptional regulator
MKRCTTCKTDKDLSEFNKNRSEKDGYTHVCKACRKESSKQRYEEKKDELLEANKTWRENNRGRANEIAKKAKVKARQLKLDSPAMCTRCGASFPRLKYKHNKYCPNCAVSIQKERTAKYFEDNAEHISEQRREYFNRPETKSQRKAYYDMRMRMEGDAVRAAARKRSAELKDNPEFIAARLAASLRSRSNYGDVSAEHIKHLYKWQEGRCYYCNEIISKEGRQRHFDHVVPRSLGGSANPDNIVLACKTCNGMGQKGNKILHREWEPRSRVDGHSIYSSIYKDILSTLADNGISAEYSDGVLRVNGKFNVHALSSFWASERYLQNASEVVGALDGVVLYECDWLNKKSEWTEFLMEKATSGKPVSSMETNLVQGYRYVTPARIISHTHESMEYVENGLPKVLLNKCNGRYRLFGGIAIS